MFNMINFNYFLNIQEDTAMKQDKNSSIDTPLKNRLRKGIVGNPIP